MLTQNGHLAIVIKEHTLGLVYGEFVQILRASILRGSHYPGSGSISLPQNKLDYRLATIADFEAYKVEYYNE